MALGCASQAALPVEECPAPERRLPFTANACLQSDAGSRAVAEFMSILDEREGDLKVSLSFGDDARVRTVCVDDPYKSGAWRERLRLGQAFTTLLELPPGPECLAGTRLDLNERRALQRDTQQLILECKGPRDSIRQLGDGPIVVRSGESKSPEEKAAEAEFLECIRRQQWWLFVATANAEHNALYVRGDPSAKAFATVEQECESGEHSPAIMACLEARGWRRVLTP